MSLLRLTADDLDDAVSQSRCLVVEFSRSVDDFAERVAALTIHDGVRFGHVDVTTQEKLAATFGIDDSALLIFRDQIVLYLESGRHDTSTIVDLIRKVGALDMAKIKAEIEAEKQAELALRMRRVCPTARRGPL